MTRAAILYLQGAGSPDAERELTARGVEVLRVVSEGRATGRRRLAEALERVASGGAMTLAVAPLADPVAPPQSPQANAMRLPTRFRPIAFGASSALPL